MLTYSRPFPGICRCVAEIEDLICAAMVELNAESPASRDVQAAPSKE
jgi:hypothetical protein